MAKQQRPIRIEQRSALSAMQGLESRTDEELEREQQFKAAAMAILGARAAERYDADRARGYFRRAVAAARPQERMQIRRMADASLAMAERRPDDLKAAMERLGQQAPSGRQLFLLRIMGLLAPPQGAPAILKVRAIALLVLIVVVLLAVGAAIIKLISWPIPGSAGIGTSLVFGAVLMVIVLFAAVMLGRRRQQRAQAKAREGLTATASGGTKASGGAKAVATAADAAPAKRRGSTRVGRK